MAFTIDLPDEPVPQEQVDKYMRAAILRGGTLDYPKLLIGAWNQLGAVTMPQLMAAEIRQSALLFMEKQLGEYRHVRVGDTTLWRTVTVTPELIGFTHAIYESMKDSHIGEQGGESGVLWKQADFPAMVKELANYNQGEEAVKEAVFALYKLRFIAQLYSIWEGKSTLERFRLGIDAMLGSEHRRKDMTLDMVTTMGDALGISRDAQKAELRHQKKYLQREMSKAEHQRDEVSLKLQGINGIRDLHLMMLDLAAGNSSMRHDSPHRLLQGIEQRLPELWKLAFPRSYQCPHRYCSPKLLAMPVFNSCLEAANKFGGHPDKGPDAKADETQCHVYSALAALTSTQVPTYFLDGHLLTDLLDTELPSDLTMKDLNWPLEHMLFMLPEGAIDTPAGDAVFLVISHQIQGDLRMIGHPFIISDHLDLRQAAVTSPFSGISVLAYTDQYHMLGAFQPLDDRPLSAYSPAEAMKGQLPVFGQEGEVLQKGDDGSEHFLRYTLPRLAITILLAMNAEPDLVEPMVVSRPARPESRKHRAIDATWHPNYFGRKYGHARRLTDAEGPGHASPRVHWRRGHFRSTFETLLEEPPTEQDVNHRVRWMGDQRRALRLLRWGPDDCLVSGLGWPEQLHPTSDLRRVNRTTKWIKRKLIGAAK